MKDTMTLDMKKLEMVNGGTDEESAPAPVVAGMRSISPDGEVHVKRKVREIRRGRTTITIWE